MTDWGYFVLALVVLASLGAYMARMKKTGPAPAASHFVLPAGVGITSVPLLTQDDVVLYNLIRIAVQDQYLVFAQVPLWSFVSIQAMGKARAQLLNQIALKRVDFLLVHPGSRQVEQVILIEETSPRPHQKERHRVIEAVVTEADIKLVKLRAETIYVVPDLTRLLGCEAEE